MEGQKQSSQVQTPRKGLGDTKAEDTAVISTKIEI